MAPRKEPIITSLSNENTPRTQQLRINQSLIQRIDRVREAIAKETKRKKKTRHDYFLEAIYEKLEADEDNYGPP
ncbi:hypothetical protein [Zooshikella ganghwensis]|uniref:Uncharacterized protein n=1 Tax=Zooshikella ganghwensis TaxID=202772 RepID=A0A4P9VRL0_9GAMM|nr:hypothetical protein [Zooshikella ganghwensis]RDH46213.1 hypothetical protein B9G39_23710 [Zooshikella ganghwensis]